MTIRKISFVVSIVLFLFAESVYAGVTASTTSSTGSHTISWTSVPDADHYRISVGGPRDSSYYIESGRSKSFSETINGTYTYQVVAWGEEVWDPIRQEYMPSTPTNLGSVDVTVRIPEPSVPSSITVPSTDNNGRFTISWGASNGIVDRYELQEKKNSNIYTEVFDGNSRNKVVSGRPDATYKYRVRGCNQSGCGNWRRSNNSLIVKNKPGVPGMPDNPSHNLGGYFSFSWSASSGNVTYYVVQEENNAGLWDDVQSSNDRSYTAKSLDEGVYKYRIKACNAYGWSCATGVGKETTVDFPDTAEKATPPEKNDGSVATIKWSSSLTGFHLKEYPTGREWQAKGPATSYIITSPPTDGDNFTYSIANCVVFNEGGGAADEYVCGDLAPQGSAMQVRHKPGRTDAPALSSTTSTDGTLSSINWSEPSGTATKYYVQKELNNSGDWRNIGVSISGFSKLNITGLQEGDWRFRIKACNEFDWSCSVGVESDLLRVRNKPAAPVSPVLSLTKSTGSVDLDWSSINGATYYDVRKHKEGTADWSSMVTGRVPSAVQASDLLDGVWSFKVRACNEFSWACSNYSAKSEDVLVRVKPGSPGTPNNPTSSHSGIYDISWSVVSGNVTHYLLQESTNGGESWNTIFTDVGLARNYSINKELEGNYLYRIKACNEFSWACTTGDSRKTTVDSPDTAGAPSVPSKSPGGSYVVSWSDFSMNGSILTEYPSGRTWKNKDINQLTISAPSDGNYAYTVRECIVFNEGGDVPDEYRCGEEGPRSSEIQVRRPPALQGGMDILLNSTNGDVIISWPPASPNGDYYKITEINTAITKTVYEPETSVTFPGREDGDYTYEYYACNNLDYCSDRSTNQDTILLTIPSEVQQLTAPANNSDGDFFISWDQSSGIVYDYKIREFSGGNWSDWILLGQSSEYSPDETKPDGDYVYEVVACNPAGCSEPEIASVTVFHPEPDAPSNLTVTASGMSRYVRIDWDRYSGDFDDYYEYRLQDDVWNRAGFIDHAFLKVPAEGRYNFEVRACNMVPSGKKCSSQSASVDSGLVLAPEPWVEEFPSELGVEDSVPMAITPENHQAVGAISGQGKVSGGSASYTIPIQLPPGRAGMQPTVSISYSSQAGNGVLGMGWQVNAGSSIARCGQTLEHDGRNLNVQGSSDDRLCLDGERLISISGSPGYGGSYHPESNPRLLVEGGPIGASPSFTISTSEGTVKEYGGSANSAFESFNPVSHKRRELSWHVNSEEDPSGNTVKYFYDNFGDGEYHISEIWYTGSDSYSGDRKVNFIYQDNARPDISSKYIAGGLVKQTKLLDRIEVTHHEEKVREYKFKYSLSESSQRSLLKSVQECAYGAGVAKCLPSTELFWQDFSPSFIIEKVGYRTSSSTGVNWDESASGDIIQQFQGQRFIEDVTPKGDINGDGVADWQGWHADAEGYKTGSNNKGLQSCQWNSLTHDRVCLSADFNRDGLTDSWRVGSSFFEFSYRFDTSGDPIWFSSQIPAKRDSGSTHDDRIKSIDDFNGDGFPDVVIRSDVNASTAYLYLHLHTGDPSDPYSGSGQLIYTYRGNAGEAILKSTVQFAGDFDGNGLPDFVGASLDLLLASSRTQSPQPKPHVLYLTQVDDSGVVYFDAVSLHENSRARFTSGGAPLEYYFHFFMDINGDTLPDWLTWIGDAVSVSLNEGGSFSEWKTIENSAGLFPKRGFPYYSPVDGGNWQTAYFPKYSHSFRLADINSDGFSELLVPSARIATNCQGLYDTGTKSSKCGSEMYSTYRLGGAGTGWSIYPVEDLDESLYEYDAVQFKEDAAGNFSAVVTSTGIIGSATQTAVVDAFGNGLQDFVFAYGCREPTDCSFNSSWAGGDFGVYVNRNRGSVAENERYEPTDMLIAVENGFGVRDEWHYRPLSSRDDRYHSEDKPFYERGGYLDSLSDPVQDDHFEFTSSMYVVAEHRQSNGLGGLNRKQYRYKGAVFNNKGRGFQGFHTIIEEDLAASIETQSDFHQIFPLAGKLDKQRKWKLGDRSSDTAQVDAFEESSYEWQFWPKGGHGSPVVVDALTDNWSVAANDPYFVGPKEQRTVHRTLRKSGSTRTELYTKTRTSSFDQWGNVLVATRRYEEAGGAQAVSSTTDTQYVAADEANWWINKPLKQTVTKHAIQNRSGVSIAADTDVEQSVVIDYLQWDSNSRKPKRVKTTPSNGKWTQVDTIYNSHGLPEKVTTTAEGETESRTVETTAFSSDGYFPKTVENSLGHTTTTITNPRFGKPDSVTNANGLTTEYEYDAFGRQITETAPSALGLKAAPDAHTALQWCYPSCSSAPEAVYKTIRQQAGTPTQITYHDSLGRVIRNEVQAFDGTDWVVTEKQFNALGQVTFESVPNNASSPNSYGTHYDSYDTLGRALGKTVDQANGQALDIDYTHEQNGGFTTNIVANGRAMSRTYNGLEQLIQTVDALGGTTKYAYDGAGNPIVLQDAAGNRITAKYNALGQKEWVNDPNMGEKSFTYTGFGEVETETDGNLDITSYTYDRLGRKDTRSVNGVEEASWTYDTAPNGIGLPHTEEKSSGGFTRTYRYDALSRPDRVTTTIDGEDFLTVNHYDSNYGRLKGLTYPSGLTLQYGYNNAGYQFRVSNAASDYTYREITQMDAWGEWEFANVAAGNYTVGRDFYAETGQMAGTAFDSLVHSHQTLAYTYDNFGNLNEKTVSVPSQSPAMNTETYVYDDLNRLDYSTRTDGPAIDYDYDAIGNLLKKDDFATSYDYTGGPSGGPSAVKSVTLVDGGTRTYGYDDNGNRTHEDGAQQIWYNAFNKPTHISRNGTDLYFSYGAGQQRYKQVDQTNNKTTIYVDKLFERITEGGTTQYRHFIEDIAVVTTTETNSETTHNVGFMHRDRLGSTVAIGNHQGNLKETHSFDPFGKPRLGNITDKLPSILDSQYTTRGFTDHEHLDSVDLIHMNGRAYDYNLGRFLSVDPFITAPGNSQALNPYSYILNNPLAGTDPSGYNPSCTVDGGAMRCTETTKVEKTGSRIKQEVTKTLTVNKNGSASYSVTSNGKTQNFTLGEKGWEKAGSSTDIGSQGSRGNLESSSGVDNKTKGLDPELVKRHRELTASCAAQSLSGSCDGQTITPEMAGNFSNLVAGTLGAVSVGETVAITAEQIAIRVATSTVTKAAPKALGHLRIGHTIPWDKMTKAQRKAFQHSYSRHGAELGLPKWSQKNAEALRQQFNSVVGHIRETGVHMGTRMKPFNGQSTRVNYYESNLNGTRYYYYETMGGQFISAGKAR